MATSMKSAIPSLPLDCAPRRITHLILFSLLAASLAISSPVGGAELTQTIERVKPSIVAIGTFLKVRSPAVQFGGTGFVVADGRYVVTNAHVAMRPLDEEKKESRVVLVSKGGEGQIRAAEVAAV